MEKPESLITYLLAIAAVVMAVMAVLSFFTTKAAVQEAARKARNKLSGGFRYILNLFSNKTAFKNAFRELAISISKRYVTILRILIAVVVAPIVVLLSFKTSISAVLAFAIVAFLFAFSNVVASAIKIAVRNKVSVYISRRYVAIVSTITVIMAILIFFSIKDLPDANKVMQTARKVGNNIAAKNMSSLSNGMDNIIHAIIGYQQDPDAARNRIYEDALKQAADKGYVFYIPQRDYYITALNKRNDERLLTEEERIRIKNSLDNIVKRSNERDQISLMNMVLSDIRVTEELWIPKERLVDLSPLDLIGVVGGYIGEHILKY